MSQIPLVSIPDNWKMERLDRLFQIRNEPARIDDPPVSAFIDGTVTLRSNRPDAIIKGSGQEIGYKHIEIGDLVISGMNAHLGGLGISDSSGKCTPVYTVMKKTIDLDSRFISYYLWHAAKSGYIKSLVNAVRYNSADFGPETIKRFMVPVPPIEEQRRIADYLDYQLNLINKMEELSNLLRKLMQEELRAKNEQLFVLSDAPRIPLRRISKVVTDKRNDLLPTVSLDLIQARRGTLNVSELPITEGLTSTAMKKGDIAFGKLRPYLGKVYLATDKTFAESEFIVMRANKNLLSEQYLSKYLLTQGVLNELESLSVGSKMPRTSWDQIASLMVPVPSLKIQQEICDGIAINESLANRKEAVLLKLSEKLDEYRISLISCVITGVFQKPWERRK